LVPFSGLPPVTGGLSGPNGIEHRFASTIKHRLPVPAREAMQETCQIAILARL